MSYVFGPVPSRRLGRSLGIDPMPRKTCDWNCVYCQLGRTSRPTRSRREYTPAKKVVAAVKQALARTPRTEIDWLTFLGAGEPTLHSRLGWMIREVRKFTSLPIAVITNGSLLYRSEVRRELQAADAVMPTLDAGTEETFLRMNRPAPGLSLEQHIGGLVDFHREFRGCLLVEVMLVRSRNDSRDELQRIAGFLERIHPDEVHLGVPTRAPAEAWVRAPDPDRIEAAGEILGVTPLPERPDGSFPLPADRSIVDAILAIIRRHPLREEELLGILASRGPVEPLLARLAGSGRAKPVDRLGTRFWCSTETVHPSGDRPTHQRLS